MAAEVTRFGVSASVGGFGHRNANGTTTALGGATEFSITTVSAAPSRAVVTGNNNNNTATARRVHQPPYGNDPYGPWIWNSVGLASALAILPFIFLGIWRAFGFFIRHTLLFSWLWICCFVVSLFISCFLDGAPPAAIIQNHQQQEQQQSQQQQQQRASIVQGAHLQHSPPEKVAGDGTGSKVKFVQDQGEGHGHSNSEKNRNVTASLINEAINLYESVTREAETRMDNRLNPLDISIETSKVYERLGPVVKQKETI